MTKTEILMYKYSAGKFSGKKAEKTAEIQCKLKKSTKGNHYKNKTWNIEDTYRYVFMADGHECEVGFYIHYKDGEVVEKVIELPTGYGCPYKCRYCASSGIDDCKILKADVMLKRLDYICKDNSLNKDDEFTLALTGTGDYSVTHKNTNAFLREAYKKYPYNRAIISSCAWNEELLEEVRALISDGIQILHVQMTFISPDKTRVLGVIPNHPYADFSVEKIIHNYFAGNSPLCGLLRINYLMLRNINDAPDDIKAFLDMIESGKDHILIRIAKLNETACSRRNNLIAPEPQDLEKMHVLCQKRGFRSYVFMSCINDNMNCGQLLTES